MKLSPVFLALAALLFAGAVPAAHASAVAVWPEFQRVPVITRLIPASAVAGSPGFQLVVQGINFGPGVTVLWNGAALAVQARNFTLTATVPATDIAEGGHVSVTVSDRAGVSKPAVFTVNNPAPALTSIQPAILTAGPLTVLGKRFIPTSVIRLNGEAMTTTYVDSGTLKTTISPTAIVAGQTAKISVFTPAPGGGSSNLLSVTVTNPVPVVTGVSPDSFTVLQSGTTLTVTGSDFVPNSTVYWNSTALSTTYVSATSLTALAPASLFSSSPLSTNTVSVGNPSPGGGMSAAIPVSEAYAVPVVTYPSKFQFTAGSGDTEITLIESAAIPPAAVSVDWNGTPLSAQANNYQGGLYIYATVPAADLQQNGTADVTVVDPSGSSAQIPVTILIPTPALNSASPSAAFGVVGGSGITATLTGTGFLQGVTLYVDGIAHDSTFVSSTEVQLTLTATDVATASTLTITAINPGTGAATSNSLIYTIGYSVTDIKNLTVDDLVWDATDQVFYANPNGSIVTIDPVAGQVIATLSTTNYPDLLAISSDDAYLYASSALGQIQRYTLPGLTPDINWSLGTWRLFTNYAEAISTIPGSPHALAVDVKPQGILAIYDDGVERANPSAQYTFLWENDLALVDDAFSWKPDGSEFFIGDFSSSGTLYDFGDDSSGVSLDTSYAGVIPAPYTVSYVHDVHFDAATGYVFTGNGAVIDPSDGAVIATLTPPAAAASGNPTGVALDDASGRIYMGYIVQGTEVLVSYDLYTYAIIDTISIPISNLGFQPLLTRWGAHGLAFTNRIGDIFILQGDFIK